MKEEHYQELLNRATSLMDERDATTPPSSLPGNIVVRGRTLSHDPGETLMTDNDALLKVYPGDIQVSSNTIRIVPFGVFNGSLDYFMAPNINGTSIFERRPPTLGRRQGGAAVYIESEFELYQEDEEESTTTGVDNNPYRARLIACNIVDRALNAPYPIQKAEVSLTVPSGTWNLEKKQAKAYRLLGVYNSKGRVFNQTYMYMGLQDQSWEYRETVLPDGRVIPPGRPAALKAPIKYNIVFDYDA